MAVRGFSTSSSASTTYRSPNQSDAIFILPKWFRASIHFFAVLPSERLCCSRDLTFLRLLLVHSLCAFFLSCYLRRLSLPPDYCLPSQSFSAITFVFNRNNTGERTLSKKERKKEKHRHHLPHYRHITFLYPQCGLHVDYIIQSLMFFSPSTKHSLVLVSPFIASAALKYPPICQPINNHTTRSSPITGSPYQTSDAHTLVPDWPTFADNDHVAHKQKGKS